MAKTKLSQVLAIEKGVRNKKKTELTQIYHGFQKPHLMSGIARTYKPKAEDGEQFPPESTKVQFKAKDALKQGAALLSKAFDLTALKDFTNVVAKADVVVDGQVLLKDAPVPYLLWLEDELTDIQTVIKSLPVLDPSENWEYEKTQDCYATPPTETVKTKKIPRNHVKAEATERHPAQVEMYTEDVVVGYWKTIKYSGALPQSEISAMLVKVEKLIEAVKYAREQANTTEVVEQPPAHDIVKFIFG